MGRITGLKGFDDIGEAARLLDVAHVNLPFKMLPRYQDIFLRYGISPEFGFGAEDLDRFGVEEIMATVDRFREKGCRITLHGPFWDLAPGSVDPLIRGVALRRIEQLMKVAEAVKPRSVVCHTGFDPRHHQGQRQEWTERSVKFWRPFVERAGACGFPILVENVWEPGPEFHAELFERIDSPWFGFCLDAGHRNVFSAASQRDWVEALAGRLGEVHVHDNDGLQDSHLPVGTGSVDFDELLGLLNVKGCEPVLTLEPHTEAHLPESLAGLAEVMMRVGWRW